MKYQPNVILSSDKYGNVLIATLEATNNAILHGNKLNEGKNVDIKCSWSRKGIENDHN